MIKDKIKLTKDFKLQTAKAVSAISLFTIVYILFILFAIGLTILCVYAGIMLIVAFPRFITIALGLGLASMGFFILIFLFKFITKSHKMDRSHLIEITKKEEPNLFMLIEEVVNQVDTNFPKKVYLSAEVNAAVFYDSSFWSMFLPIKKNLIIGLGLINTNTKDELKAILAHEFGHFSQKTMKVGSYVYNLNQVIYNMLFDNDSYNSLIQSWSSISAYFSIFLFIAIKITHSIQWILKGMYKLINISYMGLSREMEFHADEIAANVTGALPLINSLSRMSIAEYSYNAVFDYYEGKIKENIKSENIYKEQGFVMHFLAKQSDIKIENNLPLVTIESLNKFNKSKLVIKDQWASHPSINERIKRLKELDLQFDENPSPLSNELFENIEVLQIKLTQNIFNKVDFSGKASINPLNNFSENFENNYVTNTFDKIYNGYYDNKNPLYFKIDENLKLQPQLQLSNLFSEDKLSLVYTSIALQNDIKTIEQIANNSYKIKLFDYGGKKYKQKESKNLLTILNNELEIINAKIKNNDINIFNYFSHCEQVKNMEFKLQDLYMEFFNIDKDFEEKFNIYIDLLKATHFVNITTPYEEINNNFRSIQPLEKKLKIAIKELILNKKLESELSPEMSENFNKYINENLHYFGLKRYIDENLEILFMAMNNYSYLLSRLYFMVKKDLLDYQLSLIIDIQIDKEVFQNTN